MNSRIKYSLSIFIIICNYGLQEIFSQGNDTTIKVLNNKSEINNDSDIILNKDVTYQKALVNSVSFLNILPKRGIIISVCDGIKIWKLSNGKKDTIIRIGGEEVVKDLLISRDESKMIISVNCYNDREDFIGCYSLTNFKLLWRITLVNFENGLGLFAGDSLIVAVGSWDVTFIDAATGKTRDQKRSFMKKFLLPKAGGVNVLFSNSGRYVLYWNDPKLRYFSFGFGSKLGLWDLVEDKIITKKVISGFRVWDAEFLPDEKSVLAGNNKGRIKLWSLQQKEISNTWDANVSMRKSGKKDKIEVGKIIIPKQATNYAGIFGKYYDDWALKIFRYPEMKLERVLTNPDFIDFNWPAVFSNDGSYLAVSDKGYLSLYTTNDWKCIWRIPAGSIYQKRISY
jgi:WD40 repeat protein